MRKLCTFAIIALVLTGITACKKTSSKNAVVTKTNEENSVKKIASVAKKGTSVKIITAGEWAEKYPEIYASYMKNGENFKTTDYVKDYPMIATLYEGIAFSKYYSSARGHLFTVDDVKETGRPHKLANCFSCKTPYFSVMVNEMGDDAYSLPFDEVEKKMLEPITCYGCHENSPGEFTISNTYLADALGDDLAKVDAETLSCAQCHVEYYFRGEKKATTLPYKGLDSMNPDSILAFYNENDFADYVNPRTGVRQIKVQHPEFETFMGEGSVHAGQYTCADCHMGEAVSDKGVAYKSHMWTSPLNNERLVKNTCSACHQDLKGFVTAIQEKMEKRTIDIGYKLEALTNKLADAVAAGTYTEIELNEIRSLARNAQFYWDFVFVENSEGAHNSKLNNICLDKSETLVAKAETLFK